MNVSRREFLRYCTAHAALLGLSASDLGALAKVLAADAAPAIIWLQGSSCTGCSISFLDYISGSTSAADVLIKTVNVAYHPTLMGAAGESAVALAKDAKKFVLVVEGAVPTAFGGACCYAWTYRGVEHTFQQVTNELAARASHIISAGTCACFGGVSAAAPNPSGAQPVQKATGRKTMNIAGCPVHPDWIVWGITQVLLGKNIDLDSDGRPTTIYGDRIHSTCPRRDDPEASFWGEEHRCMKEIGCRGPDAYANCVALKSNGGVNWCIDANVACINCTGPGFPYSPVL